VVNNQTNSFKKEIRVRKFKRLANVGVNEDYQNKGLRIYAVEGLHEFFVNFF